MKTAKFLMMSALLMGFSMGTMAQDGTKADIDAVKNLIKSNPADMGKAMKPFYSKNKKNAENLVAFGRAFYEVKDTVNARIAAGKALDASKRSYAPAYLLLGDIEAMGENGGKAAEWYDQAIYYDPKSPDAYRKYATVYRTVSLSSALSKLEDLRTQVPDYPVDVLKAHINYLSMQYATAMQTYAKVPEANLTRLDWIEYGYSAYSSKRYEDALNICKKGLAKVPNNATLTRIAMYSAVETEKNDEARQLADQLFNKIDKDSVKISDRDYMNYGRALAADSMFKEALEQYSKGLTINADADVNSHADIHEYMADAYEGLKDYPNAIAEHQKYIDAQTTPSARDYSGTARLYMQHARILEGEQRDATLAKAQQAFRETIEKFPGEDDEYCYYQMARIANMLDPDMATTNAKENFEKVIQLIEAKERQSNTDKNRLESSYRYLLGYYGAQKDKENQLMCAKKIQELAPSDNINALVESLSKSLAE